MRLAGPGRADQAEVLLGTDPLQASKVVEAASGTEEVWTLKPSRALRTGKPATLTRARWLESSPEVISASMSVRRNSSGAQR
jgi:hypothetical protein